MAETLKSADFGCYSSWCFSSSKLYFRSIQQDTVTNLNEFVFLDPVETKPTSWQRNFNSGTLKHVRRGSSAVIAPTFLPSFFAFPRSSSAHKASSAALARASDSAWALFAAFSFAPSFLGMFAWAPVRPGNKSKCSRTGPPRVHVSRATEVVHGGGGKYLAAQLCLIVLFCHNCCETDCS